MRTTILVAFTIIALCLGLSACERSSPSGSTVVVPAAIPGPAGPAGPEGKQGMTGNQGYTGETGNTGTTGDKGDKGDTQVIVNPAPE